MEDRLTIELQKGILAWYPFHKNAKVLYMGSPISPLAKLLEQQGLKVVCMENAEEWEYEQQFDYVVAVGVLEQIKNPQQFLHNCRKALKISGIFLMTMENRFGLRYFCGDRDPYTNRSFDSIENYRRVSLTDLDVQKGKIKDKAIVEYWLDSCGFISRKCFSVFPDINATQLIYAEDYLPEEELYVRYTPYYHYPDTVFLEEMYLYTDLIKNNMFHQMANAYLFECSLEDLKDVHVGIKHVTLSMDRGYESANATLIYDNEIVVKKAIYSQGVKGLHTMHENHSDLKAHGIQVIESRVDDSECIMPYIRAEIATKHLQELLRKDKNAFIKEMDLFRQLILQSSEHVTPMLSDYEKREEKAIAGGIWLKKGYFDLVPLNAFHVDGGYMFFDQEFCLENYPANAIIVRLVDIVYGQYADLEHILPRTYFWERYKMQEQVNYLRRKNADFLYRLRNQEKLRNINELHGVNFGAIHSNRQRMNFSVDEYQKLFLNIFDDLEKYKLLLFGSGKFAKKFIDLYGSRYQIEAVLDNNESKWGSQINNISICSPDILDNIDMSECKVIICIKNYSGVLAQLKKVGVKHLGVYDTNIIYQVAKNENKSKSCMNMQTEDSEGKARKKYNVGYIAGVFDLYHIGHLNMFKRAKEQCEYLIVGVVSDEGVRKNKKTVPFIPFEERIEMVRSCKYVDEAVEIPLNYGGTRDAYRLYHFDVQFSGSDYENDPNWLAEREYLRKHGADLVFFPYTEQTSSTKIKALINKQLEE